MALKGKRLIFADACSPKAQELPATTATILPGNVLENVAGGYALSDDASTVFGKPLLIADYNFLAAGDVDTAYADGDVVYARTLPKDDFANVRVAASQNITLLNTGLARNGDGTLKIGATDGTDAIVAYADEIINTGGAAALVRVRGA